MKDPYSTLGVSKNASQDEIKRKYRTLARKMHPDINKDDPNAEDKFKELSQAYDILSNPEKKSMYDGSMMDENGNKSAGFGFKGFDGFDFKGFDPKGFSSRSSSSSSSGGFDFSSIFGGANGRSSRDPFADLFGAASRASSGNQQSKTSAAKNGNLKGDDIVYKETVSFLEAVNGAEKEISLDKGRKKVRIKIPEGTETGQQLRLRGQGGTAKYVGGQAGDAIIEITVAKHPYFSTDKNNVILHLPISIKEAMFGGKVVVPTIDGKVSVNIPAGSNTGTMLRLRGKGLKYGGKYRGDQLVKLQIHLPESKDVALEKAISDWKPAQGAEELRKDIWK